jgi:PQQ-like domain
MRSRIAVAALFVTVLVVPSRATAFMAETLPAYRVLTEYHVGLAHIASVDVEGHSLYATSSRRDSSGGRFARFDLETGERLWRQKLVCPGWGPHAFKSVVLIQDLGCSESPGTIYGVRRSDGAETFFTDGLTGVVAGDDAFLTNNIGQGYSTISVWKYSLPSGIVRWEYGPFPRDRHLEVIAAGSRTVDVLDWQAKTVTALDARDGHEVWSIGFGGSVSTNGVQAGGLLLVTVCVCSPAGDSSSSVALDAETGELVWSAPGALGSVGNGVAYLNENGAINARVVADGSLLWSAPAGVPPAADPEIGAGIVWVRVVDTLGVASMRAYDASTGAFLGTEPWPRIVGFLGQQVLVPTEDGRVLAYAPS